MAFQGKRVLVTGGSGFIPSHLCRRLLELGADLYVQVKYNSLIDNVRLVGMWDKLTPIEADLRNSDSLKQLRQFKPEIIFHLAAYNHVGDSFLHVSEAVDSNGKGSINLLEAYEDYERFVYVSTSEVYGYQERVPFQEEMTPAPQSPYALAKYAGEMFARLKWQAGNLPIVMVRPFNAYGPYQSPRAVTAEIIIKCLLGQDIITTAGQQSREFNFVENLVDGIILAGSQAEVEGQVINLGCGQEIKIRDYVSLIHQLTASTSRLRIGELPTRPNEIWRMFAANDKAKTLLGWTPRVSLTEGLTRTIAWYRRYLALFADPTSPLAQLAMGGEQS
jgi:nucleoside-diphosphate-sugar epimerase